MATEPVVTDSAGHRPQTSTTSPGDDGTQASAGGRVLRLFADAALVVLGVVGVVVIAWLLVAQLTGATLVVFKTGSMSPTIPAGGAAISMPTAAAELEVGDIVTVRREGATLPVTHRIVEIQETADQRTRELVLQGDANDVPDLAPYLVDEAPRVVASGAGWGHAITTAQSPAAMGVLTLLVAGLCLRAFWATGEDGSREEHP